MEPEGEPYVLLAMTPAGESAFVADHDRVSLLSFSARGRVHEDASIEDVETAVSRYGWLSVDRGFANWSELDLYRVEAAMRAMHAFNDPTVREYGRRDVEVVLKQVERADSDPDRRAAAVKMLTDLLVQCPIVRQDDDLFARVGQLLERVRSVPVSDSLSAVPPERVRWVEARLQLDYRIA